jgi:hypothetical protein
MNFTSEELTVVGTLAGAFIGGLFTFLATWVSKFFEERRHFRELMVRVAAENWKHTTVMVSKKPGGGFVQPFDVYLIMMLKLSKLLSQRDISAEKALELIQESERVTGAIMQHKREKKSSTKSVE